MMRKLLVSMLSMGVLMMSACASNEANLKADEESSSMKDEQSVVAGSVDTKAEAQQEPSASAMAEEEASATTQGMKNKVAVCKHGKSVRTISIIYKEGASSTSCEVTYEKASGVKTLWSAKSDLSYCSSKAEAFVKKQEGWGWKCSALE